MIVEFIVNKHVALSLILMAVAAGCADQANGPTLPTDGHTIAIDGNDPNADGVLHGYVFGVDTGAGGAGTPLLADIPVEIYQLVEQPGSVIGDSIPHIPVLRGTATTDAQGRFEVTAIPVGEYVVYAKPGAGSMWAPSQGWGMTSGGSGEQTVRIALYAKSVVGG